MNMYKCVRVSLVLLKGNWQLWKLRASLCQQSAVEESSPGKACSDPLGCALWAAPESGGEDGAQVWTHLRPSQVEGILQACVQWMPNTFKKCAWVLHVGACLLRQSQDANNRTLEQYCTLWSLKESSVRVSMRKNGREGSTFLHLLQMSHYSFNNSCTVLAQKVAPSEK